MDAPTRQQKILIGTTAVGLHVLLITLLFFIIQIDKKKIIKIELQPKQKALLAQAHDLPAALKPKKSNLGVPVVFKDIPTSMSQVQQMANRSNPSTSSQPTPKAMADTAGRTEEKLESEIEKKIKEEEKEKTETIKDLKTILTSIEKVTKHEEPDKHKKQEVVKQQQPKPSIQKQLPPKRNMSLADLTRGFLDQIKDEGNNTIKMDGDPNKMPTDEQLKHERYLQKIQWCLQNTFKIYREKAPMVAENTEVKVYLEIQQDGHIHELQIAQTSGNSSFDQFMMFAFKEASPSFPPLPQFIKKIPFQIVYTVIVYNHGWAPGGFSSY